MTKLLLSVITLKIAAVLEDYNCDYIYNDHHFESGTDRIANELNQFPYEYIVNVQADEPFTKKEDLESLVSLFNDKKVDIATLKCRLEKNQNIRNPNIVKIVTNEQGRALYFSRGVIPYLRDESVSINYFKHIGIYGYRREVLVKLSQLNPSQLELSEKLENLRMIENGFHVQVAEISEPPIAIDTLEDYELAKKFINDSVEK